MSGLWRNLLIMGYMGLRGRAAQQEAQRHGSGPDASQGRGRELPSNAPWWYKAAKGGSPTGPNGWVARTNEPAQGGNSGWGSAWRNRAPVENHDLHNLPPLEAVPARDFDTHQTGLAEGESVASDNAAVVTPVRDRGKVEARPLSAAEAVPKVAASVAIGNAQASAVARTTSVAASVEESAGGITVHQHGALGLRFSAETYDRARRALAERGVNGTTPALNASADIEAPQTRQARVVEPVLAPG